MRIVFVNLHSDWMLVKAASVYIFKFSAAIKHGYLLEYLLEHSDEYEICNYINDRGFSWLRKNNESLMKALNVFRFAENRKTMKVNGIDSNKITVLKKPSDIRPDDLVILYNICNDNFRGMAGVDAFKALSMIHFHGKDGEAQRMIDTKVNCLFNESNLTKNSEIFRRYYNVDIPWVVHPFVYAKRFENRKPFGERKNLAFATGTITYKEHPEFLEVYGDKCDQPSRKQIKDNPEFFKDTIVCTSSDYLEDNTGKKYKDGENKIIRLYKSIYNRFNVGKQKKYYSFDMVEAFNDYKMCIVGEEILGCPGIGYVEGMACGCAYIGLDSPMYTDVGLIPGKHYITYDGTKEDLRRVIEYYQMDEHQEELEQIAKAGCEFVRENFAGEVVAKRLIEDLVAEQKKWLEAKQSN